MAPPDSGTCLPAVESEVFAGPLDLLLAEVRRQNVAIEYVAMAPLAARFLEYVRSAAARNLNLDIEWLHMAATLIHWKSVALLPRQGSPQTETVRDDVVRLIQTHYKDAAGELQRHGAEEAGRLFPATRPAADTLVAPQAPAWVTVWDLAQQARDLAMWAEGRHADRRRWREALGIDPDEVTVAEMMEYLRAQLAENGGEMEAVRLLESQPTAGRRAGLFLGMLQMACEEGLELIQTEPFGSVTIKV